MNPFLPFLGLSLAIHFVVIVIKKTGSAYKRLFAAKTVKRIETDNHG